MLEKDRDEDSLQAGNIPLMALSAAKKSKESVK